MSAPVFPGRRRRLLSTDAPTLAQCLGRSCLTGKESCPKCHPTLYPSVASQHRGERAA